MIIEAFAAQPATNIEHLRINMIFLAIVRKNFGSALFSKPIRRK